MSHVREHTSWSAIMDDLATFEEFTALAGVPEVAKLEERYLPEGSNLAKQA